MPLPLQLSSTDLTTIAMPVKATEEYRIALMSLLSQLSELERLGNDFFRKMYVIQNRNLFEWSFMDTLTDVNFRENTFNIPYSGSEAKG